MNRKQIYLIIFCIHLFLINFSLSHDKTLRIIGGRDALPGEFPYVMKLEIKRGDEDGIVNNIHVCTCSLLKPTCSLTAAHCIQYLRNLLPRIKVIRHNLSPHHESSFSNVLSMFTGPNLSLRRSYMLKNDIGLLLSEIVPVSSFAKLSSVDYLTLYGSEVMSLGYGGTIGAGSYGDAHSVNKPLQVLHSIIIKCLSVFTSPAFCLAGVCNQWPASRPGDSGGPVLHVSAIVDVCSSSDTVVVKNKNIRKLRPEINSARENVAMFTPISLYIDWITNVINSNSP